MRDGCGLSELVWTGEVKVANCIMVLKLGLIGFASNLDMRNARKREVWNHSSVCTCVNDGAINRDGEVRKGEDLGRK